MKNIGLLKFLDADVNNFTSERGMQIRQKINKPFRSVVKVAVGKKIIIENYPQLEKNKPYIFASSHYFTDDIIANIATIDRNAYVLLGGTNQIEYNKLIYAAWANGFIYVNRYDKESRRSSLDKMEHVLKSGSSVLIYPEGGWNNTENLLMMELFPGVYILSKDLNIPVVPISCFTEPGSKKIYIKVGDPLNLFEMDKDKALSILRDNIANMMYEQIENYSTPIKRAELKGDIRLSHLKQRKDEYLFTKWTADVWDEELTRYISKNNPLPEQVRASFDNVTITKNNAYIFAPIIERRAEDIKYDFKRYMHECWNKND